jgi:hypothetical protein
MRLDNAPTDGQSHARALRFRSSAARSLTERAASGK